MALAATSNQTNLDRSLPEQNIEQLPSDLERIVGKTNLLAIYIVSKIKAFFTAIIYGNINSWNGFFKNVNKTFVEIDQDKKINLYQRYKKPQKDYTQVVGYKTSSPEEVTALTKSNTNLGEFKEHKIRFTNEEVRKISSFLKKMSRGTKNASNILVDLNEFLSSENIPKEIKDLIERKFDQVPEYRLLKRKLEEKKQLEEKRKLEEKRLEEERKLEERQKLEENRLAAARELEERQLEEKRLQQIENERKIKRNNLLRKAAIITAISGTVLLAGFALLQYLRRSSNSQSTHCEEEEQFVDNSVCFANQTPTPYLQPLSDLRPIVHQFIEILENASSEVLKNVSSHCEEEEPFVDNSEVCFANQTPTPYLQPLSDLRPIVQPFIEILENVPSEVLKNVSLIERSWFDIKILGRVSKEEINEVHWKIGEFFFKGPLQMAQKSIFNLIGE